MRRGRRRRSTSRPAGGTSARAAKRSGRDDAASLAAQLDQLRDSAYYRRLDETGRRRLRELLPRLMPLLVASVGAGRRRSRAS